MASAAEQLAQNFSWSSIAQAKELRQRIFFALGLLIIYRASLGWSDGGTVARFGSIGSGHRPPPRALQHARTTGRGAG